MNSSGPRSPFVNEIDDYEDNTISNWYLRTGQNGPTLKYALDVRWPTRIHINMDILSYTPKSKVLVYTHTAHWHRHFQEYSASIWVNE